MKDIWTTNEEQISEIGNDKKSLVGFILSFFS